MRACAYARSISHTYICTRSSIPIYMNTHQRKGTHANKHVETKLKKQMHMDAYTCVEFCICTHAHVRVYARFQSVCSYAYVHTRNLVCHVQ